MKSYRSRLHGYVYRKRVKAGLEKIAKTPAILEPTGVRGYVEMYGLPDGVRIAFTDEETGQGLMSVIRRGTTDPYVWTHSFAGRRVIFRARGNRYLPFELRGLLLTPDRVQIHAHMELDEVLR